MRLDPKTVRFISPFTPSVFVQKLRFSGRENTVQLQEAALAIEGNILKVGLLGLDTLFRPVLAEWSSVTIPYSCIALAEYIRFPLPRLLALIYLWLWPAIAGLVLARLGYAMIGAAIAPIGFVMAYFIPRLHPVAAVLVGLFAGPLGLLAAYVIVRVPGRFRIDFRTRGNECSRLLFQVRERRLADAFGAKLKEYRKAVRQIPRRERRKADWSWRSAAARADGSVARSQRDRRISRVDLRPTPAWAVRILQTVATSGDDSGRPTPPSRNSARSGITLLPGSGTTTPITFEPLRNDPAAAPSSFEMSEIPTSMAWLPDGRLAFATRGEIWLADLNAWKGTRRKLDPTWKGNIVALSPDAAAPAGVTALFTSSTGSSIYLWPIGSGAAPTPLPRSDFFVLNASIDPTGSTLTYSSGTALRVWDLKTRLPIESIPKPPGALFGRADYTVDGKRFAVIDLLSNKAVLWWQGNPTTERTGIQAAAWSPDGSTLAVRTAGDGSAIQVLDPRTTSELKSIRSVPGPGWLRFSADGRVLAGGAGDGMAFWDAKTGRELGRIDTRHAVALARRSIHRERTLQ